VYSLGALENCTSMAVVRSTPVGASTLPVVPSRQDPLHPVLATPAQMPQIPAVEVPRRSWPREHAVLEPMDPRAKLVCSSPNVWVIDDFLAPGTAQAIIAEHDSKLRPSEVVKKHGGGEIKNARTSSSAPLSSSPQVTAFKADIARMLSIDPTLMEAMSMVRYQAGQEYKSHYDWFSHDVDSQREWTVLIYLNDVDPGDGGETAFLSTGTTPLLVRPKEGRAVIWRNLLPSGFVDTRTLHAGLPPKRGSKYAINVWTRTGPFPPFGDGTTPELPLHAPVDKPVQRQGLAVGSPLPVHSPVLKVPLESSLTPRVPGPGASPALPSHTPALTGLSATLLSPPLPPAMFPHNPALPLPPESLPCPRVPGPSSTSPVESAPSVPCPTLQLGAPSANSWSRVDVRPTVLHRSKLAHLPPDAGPENRCVPAVKAEGMRLSPVSMRTGPSSQMRHMAPHVPVHVSCT